MHPILPVVYLDKVFQPH